MKNSLPKNLLLIFLLTSLSLFSCAKKEKKYDKESAISAFATVDPLKIDDSLAQKKITIPAQKNITQWKGFYHSQNQEIENIAFDFSGEKSLKKTSQIWSGYLPAFSNRFVFSPLIIDEKIL